MSQTPFGSLRSSETSRDCRRRADCRLCGSGRLELRLALSPTPPANEFVSAGDIGRPQDTFPLDVFQCADCGHVQLLDIVNPERLFRNYVYVSGTSPVFVDHFRRYAEAVIALAGLAPGAQVVDIGSNDGTFLKFFKAAGMRVLGIDPARAIAEQATKQGIETRPEFFDPALAARLRADGWQPAVIAANNVYAHADDLGGIADGVAHLLAPDGVFVFEVSYLLDVVDKLLFDTIYHEHVSYHSVKPLVGFLARHGLHLIDAVRVDPHGGSLRVIAQRSGGPRTPSPAVAALIAEEEARGLYGPDAYHEFSDRLDALSRGLRKALEPWKANNKRIAGFGAPAKATTLMYQFGVGRDWFDFIIDDSPWKQGRFSPGLHIPVVSSTYLYDALHKPDVVVVLAWNFADSIIQKHQKFIEAGGRFIVPLPELKVV